MAGPAVGGWRPSRVAFLALTAGAVVIHIKGVVEDRSFPGTGAVTNRTLEGVVTGRGSTGMAADTVGRVRRGVIKVSWFPGSPGGMAGRALPGEMDGRACCSVA
jgi:hypothetical protein